MADFAKGNVANEVYGTGDQTIHPLDEIRSLLRSDAKIYRNYQGILSSALPFWARRELRRPISITNASTSKARPRSAPAPLRATSPSTIQHADIEFYVNSGIYCSIELEQLWPVTVNGRSETLVWRDDLVSTSNIAYLHGTERLASGMIMLQDVKQAIDAFRTEFR